MATPLATTTNVSARKTAASPPLNRPFTGVRGSPAGPVKATESFPVKSSGSGCSKSQSMNGDRKKNKSPDVRVLDFTYSEASSSGHVLQMHRSASSDAILSHYLAGEWPKPECQVKQSLSKFVKESSTPITSHLWPKGGSTLPRTKSSPSKTNKKFSQGSNEGLNQELERLTLSKEDLHPQKFEIPPDGHRAPINELLSMNGEQVSPDQLTSYMGNHLLRRLPDDNSSDDVGSLDSSPVRKSTLLADVKFVKPLRNQIFRPTPEGCEKNEKGDSESCEEWKRSEMAKPYFNIPSTESAFRKYPVFNKNNKKQSVLTGSTLSQF